jgi:arginine deiminase
MYKLNQISIDTPKTLTEVKNEYVRVTMWDKFVHYLEKQSHEIVKKWDLFKNSNGNGPQSRHTFIEHYVTKNVILPKRSIYDSKMFEELLEEKQQELREGIYSFEGIIDKDVLDEVYLQLSKPTNNNLNTRN